MMFQYEYDASTFDDDDPSTWPTTSDLTYTPDDFWYIATAGTIQGAAAVPGDLLYVTDIGDQFGLETYGAGVHGSKDVTPPWQLSPTLRWSIQSTTGAVWEQQPAPSAGCELAHGWRLVIELYDVDAAHTYGERRYGVGAFGGVDPVYLWEDITRHCQGALIQFGNTDPAPIVNVDAAILDVLDETGDVWPLDGRSSVGRLCRVSMLSPTQDWYPIYSGRVDDVTDVHDPAVRRLTVDTYGVVSTLAGTLTDWSAPAETAQNRAERLLNAVGWSYGPASYPAVDVDVLAVEPVEQIAGRQALDVETALSAGWQFDADRRGLPRFRQFPIDPTGDPVLITDRLGATELPSPAVTVVANVDDVLNVAIMSSDVPGAEPVTRTATDPTSAQPYEKGGVGRRSDAIGFPISGLAATTATMDRVTADTVARHGRTVTRIAAVEADIAQDARWLPVLAGLDTGRPIRFVRTKPFPLTLDGIVVGVEHRMTRQSWTATVHVSSTTPSF